MTGDHYIYDLEVYPNVFTCAVYHVEGQAGMVFELSERRDDRHALLQWLQARANAGDWMVGFNNVNFDYPILHLFIESEGRATNDDLYQRCAAIIRYNGEPWVFRVKPWEVHVRQIDLFLIHHFDNKARRTGLKQVEFNMRVPDLMDLPFTPGEPLTVDQVDPLIKYNYWGDVMNTLALFEETRPMIEFRKQLSEQHGRDFINHNDTKIGKDVLIMQLQAQGVACYDQDRAPIQTHRPQIALADVIFPYIDFRHPEFRRVLDWLKGQTITETRGVFKDLTATVEGFDYVFGLGGIHGSVSSQAVYSDEEWIVEDWDVASYYPNLAIANKVYPEHLTSKFCDIYKDIYEARRGYAKGTPENAMYKLALNGVYGDSNNMFSPYYDPQYTMTITINGQLLLCLLAQELLVVPGLQMIQINTDGLTVRYRRQDQSSVHAICQWWEGFTCLTLEQVEYQRMHIRDVNNYVAVGADGKVKRKGAYEYERAHHQNQSMLVVPKVAEQVLLHGADLEQTVRTWPDIYDFMIRVKKPVLYWGDEQQQSTCRYYVSHGGASLIEGRKPPPGKKIGDYKKGIGVSDYDYDALNETGVHNPEIHTKNRSKYEDTRVEVEKGFTVTVANNIMDAVNPINYDFYIKKVRDLVAAVR